MRWPRLRRGQASWVWAFAAQGSSSASSLLLSLVAGRALGTSGLGVVFAGFAAYLLVLNLHRGLVSTPLVSSSSTIPPDERARMTGRALTVTLTFGLSVSALLALVGLAAGGPLGEGLLAFAPWVLPAFAHDLFRSSLFRDGRGRLAALTDIAWLGTLGIAAVAFAFGAGSPWAVVSAWGLGALAASLLGAVFTRARPARPNSARAWFVDVAFPFGRWLAVQEGTYSVGSYALVVILTVILGASSVGGMRAAETIFAPFSLLAAALVLPGLPAVSRSLERSRERAVRLAATISAAGIGLTVTYLLLMTVVGERLLTALFGGPFEAYSHLVVPFCVWQMLAASGLGFAILLRAEQRGRAILAVGVAAIASQLVASSLLALAAGVAGAVWGLAIGAAVGSSLLILCGVRVPGAAVSGVPRRGSEPVPPGPSEAAA